MRRSLSDLPIAAAAPHKQAAVGGRSRDAVAIEAHANALRPTYRSVPDSSQR